jgi:hypothetical protein
VGYDIRTAASGIANCGGVALLVRENDEFSFTVKNEKVVGPNVISCGMVTGRGKKIWFIVGCYLPPSDKEGVTQRMVVGAIKCRPRGTCPIVIGDLNSNLDFPRDRQEEILAANMDAHGLGCAMKFFQTCRRRKTKEKWTFRRWEDRAERGERRWIRSKPDYFLMWEQDRPRVKRCRWISPRNHNSDHRTLVVKLSDKGGWVKPYIRK